MKHHPFLFLPLMALCLGVLPGCFLLDPNPDNTETLARTLVSDGLTRKYRVYVPESKQGPLPLVMGLHGTSQNPEDFRRTTKFNLSADSVGFVAVYPEAVELNWNDGRAVPGIPAYDQNVDDVKFLQAVIDAVDAEFDIDPSRVYAAGFSNGAMMAMRLGVEVPETLAAIGAVAAALPENIAGALPESPVPMLMINSLDDPVLPWEGGEVFYRGFSLGRFLSVPDTVDFWVEANGAAVTPQVSALPNTENDGCTVSLAFHAPGEGSADVLLYTIDGGGHSWPSGALQISGDATPVCQDINATTIMLTFFAHFQRP